VRLHCFHAAAERFVVPVLAKLTSDHPRIVLDVTIDDTVVDLVKGGFDAAIRLGEVIERDMVRIPLGGVIHRVAVAAPAYLALHGIPAQPQDLLGHRCIRWRWPGRSQPYEWEFCESEQWFAVAVDGPVIANDRLFVLRAALDGVGVAFLKEASVAPFVADGRLVTLLDRWSAPFPGFHLCYPRQQASSPVVRAVVDAITSEAEGLRD
jgi:DNA-binding transcriptional LysR family regulator